MVFSAGGWSVLGALIEKILMLSTYAIVSHKIDPVEFGYLVLVLLIVELMGYVSGFGLGANIVRKKELTDAFMSSAFYFVCCVSLVLTLIMCALITPLTYIVSGDHLALLVLSMALYPALTTFSSFYLATLQRDMRFKEIAYRTAIVSVLSGAVGVSLALFDFGVFSLIVARYAYSISDLIILRRLTNFSLAGYPDNKELIGILGFGWRLSASQLLNFSSARIYEIFVVALFGPAYLAILDVGRKLLLTFYNVVFTPLSSVCLSFLSKSATPVKSYFIFVTAVGLFAIPAVAIVGGLAERIVIMFFGDVWVESGGVLSALSVGVIAQSSAWFLPLLSISRGDTKAVFHMNIMQISVLLLFGWGAYLSSANFEQLICFLVVALFISSFLNIIYLRIIMKFPVIRFVLLLFMSGVLYLFFYIGSKKVFNFSFEFVTPYLGDNLYSTIFSLFPVVFVFIVYLMGVYMFKRILWK